eukprot:m51a1_g7178 hypothetical protein (322) ;mRNA; r:77664-80878
MKEKGCGLQVLVGGKALCEYTHRDRTIVEARLDLPETREAAGKAGWRETPYQLLLTNDNPFPVAARLEIDGRMMRVRAVLWPASTVRVEGFMCERQESELLFCLPCLPADQQKWAKRRGFRGRIRATFFSNFSDNSSVRETTSDKRMRGAKRKATTRQETIRFLQQKWDKQKGVRGRIRETFFSKLRDNSSARETTSDKRGAKRKATTRQAMVRYRRADIVSLYIGYKTPLEMETLGLSATALLLSDKLYFVIEALWGPRLLGQPQAPKVVQRLLVIAVDFNVRLSVVAGGSRLEYAPREVSEKTKDIEVAWDGDHYVAMM